MITKKDSARSKSETSVKSRSSSPGRGGRKLRFHCWSWSSSFSRSREQAALTFWYSRSRLTSSPPGVLLLGQVLLPGQEHLGLDVDEEGGDEQELGLPVEVDLLLPVEVLQVVPGDGGDGDVVDLDLLLPDEEEEQVQGAFEDLEPDLVAFRRFGRGSWGFGSRWTG